MEEKLERSYFIHMKYFMKSYLYLASQNWWAQLRISHHEDHCLSFALCHWLSEHGLRLPFPTSGLPSLLLEPHCIILHRSFGSLPQLLHSLQSTWSSFLFLTLLSFFSIILKRKNLNSRESKKETFRCSKGKWKKQNPVCWILQEGFGSVWTLLGKDKTTLPEWQPIMQPLKNWKYNLPHYPKQRADLVRQHLQLSEAPWNKYHHDDVEKG